MRASIKVDQVQKQQHLAESIKAQNNPISERIINAFLTVPRHKFIDHYYIHQPGTRNWTLHEREETSGWYEQIYSDQPLMTQVDEHGRSLSSSSQPGIMATMLEALGIEPGMRVLEIGTGTGYNAALLASLTEEPRLVTTIDIDPQIIEHARRVLTQVVEEGITVALGDGINGYSEHAPYDRIIVTASTAKVPWAWKEQLAPDGIVVCILQPGLAMLGGLLKAQKQADKLIGNILCPASFMLLRDAIYAKHPIQLDFRAPLYASSSLEQTLFDPLLIREDHDFAFFLYYDIPDLHVF